MDDVLGAPVQRIKFGGPGLGEDGITSSTHLASYLSGADLRQEPNT